MKSRFPSWPDLSLLLAAAGGVTFFVLQHRSAATLEAENARLSQRIESAATTAADEPSDISTKAREFEKAGPAGMVKLAALLRSADGGNPAAFRDALALETYWRTLDAGMIEKLIADVYLAELSEEDRERLAGKLLDALAEKHPDRAFAMIELGFAGQTSRQIQQQLSWKTAMFERWIQSDSTAAAAWLDKQIASGAFDSRSIAGTSEVRQSYEALLLKSLLKSDPKQAATRMAEVALEDRVPTLSSWRLNDLPKDMQAGFAAVARSLLAPEEVAAVLKPMLQKEMASGDLTSADAFFESISATPEELPILAENAAGQALFALGKRADQLTGEEVPAIRSWLSGKSSEGDSYIGSMIGKGFSNGWDAGQIYTTINRLQKDHPSDDLIGTFLVGASQGGKQKLDPATATALASQINDPGKRAIALNAIGTP